METRNIELTLEEIDYLKKITSPNSSLSLWWDDVRNTTYEKFWDLVEDIRNNK